MEYKLYNKEYILSLNSKYDMNILSKYNLATNNEINNNFVNLYSCFKNYLDQYIINYFSGTYTMYIDLIYAVRFDKMSIEDYNDLIVSYNEKNSSGILNAIIKVYSNIVEYKGKSGIGLKYNDVKIKNMLLNVSDKINTNIDLIEDTMIEKAVSLDNIEEDLLEMEKYPKYLPLGSVILTKKDYLKYMIMGYVPITPDGIKYDYLLCFYPSGIIKSDFNILINHEDIRKILYMGLVDDEQQDFMVNFNKYISNQKNN